MNHSEWHERVARVVRQCLEEGSPVDIDGLGVFRPSPLGGFEFVPYTKPGVFLAYVEEDLPAARRLFEAFTAAGFDPWLDREKLLPGQNWPRSIERAIDLSDFFVACFSTRSVGKRGQFQAELRYALDCARRQPLDEIYLIPVRLDNCQMPRRVAGEIQWVDLFPSWDLGVARVLSVMRVQLDRRRRLPLAG